MKRVSIMFCIYFYRQPKLSVSIVIIHPYTSFCCCWCLGFQFLLFVVFSSGKCYNETLGTGTQLNLSNNNRSRILPERLSRKLIVSWCCDNSLGGTLRCEVTRTRILTDERKHNLAVKRTLFNCNRLVDDDRLNLKKNPLVKYLLVFLKI